MTSAAVSTFNEKSGLISEGDDCPPTSIRFSKSQKAKLKAAANGKPIGPFVRSQLFDDDGSLRPHKVRPVDDPQALAQLLARLGQSQLPNNLNQMTKLAHSGALPVTPEVCEDLTRACREISEMRSMLIRALGLRR